ncbi:MAG: flagellar filament capping protein FliD [Lachnospiraceae bacterium]|nr:flagellar filament capping protein FliD [Lachnospiraceae bacterium]
MAIRVSGLVSGLDTDSIVQELVSAYSTKKDKYVKAQTKLDWKMDAWKELNKKVNKLYKRLGNMKLSSYYNKKTTTISDSTKATVTASNSALNGTQKLTINQVASTGYITGGVLKDGTTADSTLGQLGMADGKGTIAVATKKGTTNIEVSSDMTLKKFINKLKDAGVSASYDASNNRIFVSAKESGADNDFALTATDANGLSALKGMGLYVRSDANDKAYAAWEAYTKDASGNPLSDADIRTNLTTILDNIATIQGDDSTVGSIAYLQNVSASEKTKLTNYQADRNYAMAYVSMKNALKDDGGTGTSKLTQAEQDELEAMLWKTDSQLKDDGEDERFEELKTKLGISDDDMAKLRANAKTVVNYEDAANPAYNQTVVQEVKDNYGTSGMETWLENNANKIETTSENIKANNDLIASKQAYVKEHALLTGAAPAGDGITTADRVNALMEKIDFVKQAKDDYVDPSTLTEEERKKQATRINGSNAEITLNGATYVSASNDITVNGITITALQKTDPGEELTITTQANVQGIYDSIKDFLTEYNALMKEMDQLYNADSAKGYEPLTDEEKEAMSDKEIDKWEEKIKGSILRRDDTLSSVMSLMTSSMSKGFTLSDGKKYSLASFGIKTQGYFAAADNEGKLYHIDGDSEDEISAGNNGGNNALLKAIQDDPDKVQEFFQKLSDDLYTRLDKKMQSTTMNSRFSIYHDKKMKNDYDDYTKTIKKWEEKVSAMEDKYYKQFAAMEKALSSLQSSTSALSGLLGS